MGTKCALIYANLFMNHFEETYIYQLLTTNVIFIKGISMPYSSYGKALLEVFKNK